MHVRMLCHCWFICSVPTCAYVSCDAHVRVLAIHVTCDFFLPVPRESDFSSDCQTFSTTCTLYNPYSKYWSNGEFVPSFIIPIVPSGNDDVMILILLSDIGRA